MHGASLTFTAYLEPGRAALLEVALDKPDFQHYHNLAQYSGVQYHSVCTPEKDHMYTTNVTEALWEVMREVAVMRARVAV